MFKNNDLEPEAVFGKTLTDLTRKEKRQLNKRRKAQGMKGLRLKKNTSPSAVHECSNEEYPDTEETDDEIVARIRDKFATLKDITQAACDGVINAAVVSGPGGLGKTWGVQNVLENDENISGWDIVSGVMTPINLYMLLWKFQDKDKVLVLDDCDVWGDEDSMALLKAALDTTRERIITWRSSSHLLKEEEIEQRFVFHGNIIFITNMDFDRLIQRQSKFAKHLEALRSRVIYLDLTLKTQRDKLLRIRQVMQDSTIVKDQELTPVEGQEVMDFIETNVETFAARRQLNLRTVIKIAKMRRAWPDRWQKRALELV